MDGWARLMAQFIGKHIPGNPNPVVQNMPGGGSMAAANSSIKWPSPMDSLLVYSAPGFSSAS